MGNAIKNLLGKKIGLLSVVSLNRVEIRNGVKFPYWNCLCDCGNLRVASREYLQNGGSVSCGCYRKINPQTYYIHKHPLYRIWSHIKTRCYNKKSPAYKNYGGRGIKMSKKWKNNFLSFYKDVLPIYVNGKTIERINVNSGYFLKNICFIEKAKQAINRRTTIFVEIDGVKKPVSYWCSEYGMNISTVCIRIRNGWDAVSAIKTPPSRLRRKFVIPKQ